MSVKKGKLERLYARNEFTVADSNNFVELQKVPDDKINLRQALMKCCKQSNRCSCLLAGVKCNS